VVGVLFLSSAILFISLTKASLNVLAKDRGHEQQKIQIVKIVKKTDDGGEIESVYKLPQATILPDHWSYGFKEIRDWLWLKMSPKKKRLKLALLLADKKIVEAQLLAKKGKYDLSIQTASKSVQKLKKGENVCSNKAEENVVLCSEVSNAHLAYTKILKSVLKNMGDNGDINRNVSTGHKNKKTEFERLIEEVENGYQEY